MNCKINLIELRDSLIYKRRNTTSECKVSQHICAILKDGVPISYGINNYTPNKPIIEHAEAHAFRKLLQHIDKSAKRVKIDIFVVRTNGSNSKPCTRCIDLMQSYKNQFNIRNIYYSAKDSINGIRCVKFSKLVDEERHVCSYDRWEK
jgi:tRNA(Arg) A34 adenosine deaminase TadA